MNLNGVKNAIIHRHLKFLLISFYLFMVTPLRWKYTTQHILRHRFQSIILKLGGGGYLLLSHFILLIYWIPPNKHFVKITWLAIFICLLLFLFTINVLNKMAMIRALHYKQNQIASFFIKSKEGQRIKKKNNTCSFCNLRKNNFNESTKFVFVFSNTVLTENTLKRIRSTIL